MVDNTDLPPGICCPCYEATLTTYRFRDLCHESNKTWHIAVDSLSDIEDPMDVDQTYYVFYNEGVETIIRDQISRVTSATEALERITVKPSKTETVNRKKHERIVKKCKCPDCGKPFQMPYFLNQHLIKSTKRACLQCGAVVTKQGLAKHLQKHGKSLIPCKVCHELFDDIITLESHFETNHGSDKLVCISCGVMYTNARALRAHMYSHSLFHCSYCNLSFENRKCSKYHQNNCSKSKEKSVPFNVFICDYCGIKYDKKPSLKMHIVQKHLNVLPFVCQICGKKTSTLAHLRSHETVHSKNRPVFLCHCGAQMRTYLGFQLHQRIHTGEKPYQCADCGECFLSASRRLDHIKRRHRSTKDMPHVCDKCNARFVRPYELKKHYAMHQWKL